MSLNQEASIYVSKSFSVLPPATFPCLPRIRVPPKIPELQDPESQSPTQSLRSLSAPILELGNVLASILARL